MLLLALAAFAFLIVLLSLAMGVEMFTNPNVAKGYRGLLFLDLGCLAVALASLMTWAGIHKYGLGQMLLLAFFAIVFSATLTGLTAWGNVRAGELTAVPENLLYSSARGDCLWPFSEFPRWCKPTDSERVERWDETHYGFPIDFLHVCKGLTIDAQYVMVDWHYLGLDWLLALAPFLALILTIKHIHRGRLDG